MLGKKITLGCFLQNYKGKGIGKLLFAAAKDYLKAYNYENLLVWTLVNNDAAINFYRSIGFKPTDWRKQTRVGDKFYEELALSCILV